MAFEALLGLLADDAHEQLASLSQSGEDVRFSSVEPLLTDESLPPVPEGYVNGQTGGYWQDPVSKKWQFIPGAGLYNDKGVYIFDNLFKR